MKKEEQANVLSAWVLKKMFPACILYALIVQMIFMVDTVIGGKMLGPDAVAAVAIGLPVAEFMMSFMLLILQGCFSKLIQYMGRGDKDGFHRTYSLSFWLTIVVGLICTLVPIVFAPLFVRLNGGEKSGAALAVAATLYIRAFGGIIILYGVSCLLQVLLRCYGYVKETMYCCVMNVISNVTFSIVAIKLLPAEYKIVGLGIGSSMAGLVQLVLAAFFLQKKGIRFCPERYHLIKKDTLDMVEILRAGVPSATESFLESVIGTLCNNLILSLFSGGTIWLSMAAIVKSVHTMVKTPAKAAQHISEPLFGICFNSCDLNGLKKSLTDTYKTGFWYCVGCSVIFVLLCNRIMSFYQMGGDEMLRAGILIVVVCSPLYMIQCTMNGFFECTEQTIMSMAFAIVPEALLYPMIMVLLAKPLGPMAIWIGMGMSIVPLILVIYLFFAWKYRTFRVPLDKLLLLEEEITEHLPSIDISISANEREVTDISEKIQNFFRDQGVSEQTAYMSALCAEEIAADYITHRNNSPGRKNRYSMMDLKTFCDEERIEIIIRNYDQPYNPLDFELDPEDFSKIGIYMMQKQAKNINYIYAFHLNVVTVTLDKI